MYDIEQIAKILADLDKYFRDIENFKIQNQMTTEQFYGSSMILFAILNRTIDLGKEIIHGKKLGMPASYKEIFQILEKEKLISSQLSQELQWLTNQRNVVAHEYFDIKEKNIVAIYNRIKSVKEFMIKSREIITNKKAMGKNN